MPVNMPTHAHGQGYSDLNFLIPELVSGVQYLEGPVLRRQGDFATAGSANINYANVLDEPIVRVGGGGEGFGARAGRGLADASATGTCSRRSRSSTTTARGSMPDDYQQGQRRRCATAAATRSTASRSPAWATAATWNSTDQVPQRAIDDGLIGRFGALDPTDGGDTYRYSGSVEWQRSRSNATHQGRRLRHRLRPEPVLELHLLPRRPGPRRSVPAGRSPVRHRRQGQPSAARTAGATARCRTPSACRCATTTSPRSACTTPRRAQLLDTVRRTPSLQTSVGGYAQNEIAWTPWLRTLAGLRVDGYRFDVDAGDPANSGTTTRRHRQPEGRRRVRAVQRHRALRQRRARLPQQRRARRRRSRAIRRPASRSIR